MNRDEELMGYAVALAMKGEGLTRPNPPVGAIVVRRGKVVGRGYHKQAGKAHAEVVAINNAGEAAKGSTLYVTLEPCCTFGKTPPCVNLIVDSGIKRVVVSTRDPNPDHKGRGVAFLKKHGVDVVEGVCARDGERLIAPFAKWISTGEPYVTLKLGVSFDGKISDLAGASRWITCPASRRVVQNMRRRADAMLVGAGTVLADDPSLLPVPSNGRMPFRVILDAEGSVSASVKVLRDDARFQTIMVTTKSCPSDRQKKWNDAGAIVWVLREKSEGVSLRVLLKRLGQTGVLHVLCEGGSDVAAALIKSGLVDEYVFFVAPRIIGGVSAKSAVGGSGWPLEKAPKLRFIESRFVGDDIMIRAEPVAD